MNKQEIEQSIKKMEDELAKMKESLKEKKVGRFIPEAEKDFWFLSYMGEACETVYIATKYDGQRFLLGNMFATKEQAEHFAKKRAARQRLECLALALNGEILEGTLGEYRSDDDYTTVYNIQANKSCNRLDVNYENHMESGCVLFKTEALANQAIELTSNEDLITMFGVGK